MTEKKQQLTTHEPQKTNDVVVSGGQATFNALVEAVKSGEMSAETVEKLIGANERIMAKQAEIEFNQAMARMMPLMPRIRRSGKVEYAVDKNKPEGPKKKAFNFATYEDIDKIIRPLLSAEGFSLSFDATPRPGDGGGIIVTGTLAHVGGHSRSASIPIALDASGGKNNIQAMGSSFSYGKRYTATMLLNIVTEGEDDDGVKGGAKNISEEQITQLEEKIKATKSDKDKFLKFFVLENLEDMPAREFDRAMNALVAKEKEKKEGVI